MGFRPEWSLWPGALSRPAGEMQGGNSSLCGTSNAFARHDGALAVMQAPSTLVDPIGSLRNSALGARKRRRQAACLLPVCLQAEESPTRRACAVNHFKFPPQHDGALAVMRGQRTMARVPVELRGGGLLLIPNSDWCTGRVFKGIIYLSPAFPAFLIALAN